MNTLAEVKENFYNIRHNNMIISLSKKQISQLYKLFSESNIMLNFEQFKSLVSSRLVITFYNDGGSLCFFLANRADILWYKIVYSLDLKQILEFNSLKDFEVFMSKVVCTYLRMERKNA